MSREEDSWKGWWDRFGKWWDSFDRSKMVESDSRGEEGEAQRSKRLRNLILLALLGAGMMMMSQRSTQEVSTTPPTLTDTPAVPVMAESRDSIELLQRQVAALLSQVAGVGRVEVLIVPKTSDIKVFAQEVTERTSLTQSETDGRSPVTTSREESVTRRPVIINNDGSKSQQPVVEYVQKPQIAGVLVVAEGADEPNIRLQVLKAVAALLDLPAHRIDVIPRKP